MLAVFALLVCSAERMPPSDPRACDLTCYTGTIEYLSDDGLRRKPRSGSVTVWRRRGLRWHTYIGDIIDGGVWVEMPACNDAIDIGRIVVDGQEAFVVDTAWPHIRWLARPAKPVQLNVFDAISNTPAQRIEVREFESTTPPDDVRPSVVMTKDASSRVMLPAWSTDPDPWFVMGAAWRPKRRFWICTPGSPWESVVADFERGGVLDVVVNTSRK